MTFDLHVQPTTDRTRIPGFGSEITILLLAMSFSDTSEVTMASAMLPPPITAMRSMSSGLSAFLDANEATMELAAGWTRRRRCREREDRATAHMMVLGLGSGAC